MKSESESVSHCQAPLPWNSSGKNTGVGSCFLLQGFSWPNNQTSVSCVVGSFFAIWATRETPDEEWAVVNMAGLEVRSKCSKLGETYKVLFVRILLSVCLQRQGCSFPWYREAFSHRRVLWPVSSKKGTWGGGQNLLAASQTPSTLNSIWESAIYGGNMPWAPSDV